MEATPTSRMSQRGRSKFMRILGVFIVLLHGGALSGPVNNHMSISIEEGKNISISPCKNDQSQNVSFFWGRGLDASDDNTWIQDKRTTKEKGRLVITNARLNDSGDYWCTVTPQGEMSIICTINLTVWEKTAEPAYKEITESQERMATRLSSSSSAERIFVHFQVLRNICLLSGILTTLLTNFGGLR